MMKAGLLLDKLEEFVVLAGRDAPVIVVDTNTAPADAEHVVQWLEYGKRSIVLTIAKEPT